MSSNIRPRNPSKESPTEPFKRAVAGCLRAIARKPALEVAYAAERPGIVGGKARLPEPPRKLAGPDAAIEEAIALMVRERLTGQLPPAAAMKLVELWRPLIEDRAGRNLDRLERLI